MRQTRPKKIITTNTDYIPIGSLKSTNCSLNIIEGGVRCYDIGVSQYIDFSTIIDKYYQLNTPINISLITETKIDDNSPLVKFKLELKDIYQKSVIIEKECIMNKELNITECDIHSFKIIKLEKNPIFIGRLTRTIVSNGHHNNIWIHGIKVSYNVSNC